MSSDIGPTITTRPAANVIKKFYYSIVCYSEIMHSDWLKEVMWLETSNQSALFPKFVYDIGYIILHSYPGQYHDSIFVLKSVLLSTKWTPRRAKNFFVLAPFWTFSFFTQRPASMWTASGRRRSLSTRFGRFHNVCVVATDEFGVVKDPSVGDFLKED